jgi:hypothetical protein
VAGPLTSGTRKHLIRSPYPLIARLFATNPTPDGERGKSADSYGASVTFDRTTQPPGGCPPQSVTLTVTVVSFVSRKRGKTRMLDDDAGDVLLQAARTPRASHAGRGAICRVRRPM